MKTSQRHERLIVGLALFDAGAAAIAAQLLDAEMFADRKLARIFQALAAGVRSGKSTNLVTLSDEIPELRGLMNELVADVGSTGGAEYSCRRVQEGHLSRQGLLMAQQLRARLESGEDVFEVLDRHIRGLTEAMGFKRIDTHVRHAVEEAIERLADWERGDVTDRVPSGIWTLDRITGGLPVAEMTTLAAETGMGKTAMVAQLVVGYAQRLAMKHDLPVVLVFSAEMTREQLVHRCAANLSGVSSDRVRLGKAQSDDRKDYRAALDRLRDLPIHLDDTPNPTPQHMAATMQRLAYQGRGLGLVFVDYDEKVDEKGASEELRVSRIAQTMKRLAKENKVPLVSLSQYSRGTGRPSWPEDGRLRYSGKKAQESAMILHWYWPQHWVRKGFPDHELPGPGGSSGGYVDERTGYLVCTKNRFGATGHMRLLFSPALSRFEDPNEPRDGQEKKDSTPF